MVAWFGLNDAGSSKEISAAETSEYRSALGVILATNEEEFNSIATKEESPDAQIAGPNIR